MNLPKAKLDRDVALKLWCDTHSDYAKEQVVLGNLGLIGMVMKRLKLNLKDEDLFSLGMIGLLKALNSYDVKKGFEFSSYSTMAIRNEILQTFRKKTDPVAFSLDESFFMDDGDSVPYSDMIADDKDFTEEVLFQHSIANNLAGLSDRERRIIGMRLQRKTQREIAEVFGVSQSYVSRIIKGVRAQICA